MSSSIDGPSALAALRGLCRALDDLEPPSLLWRAGSAVLIPAALGLGGGCGACGQQEAEPAPPPPAVVEARVLDAAPPNRIATDAAPEAAPDAAASRDADGPDADQDRDAEQVEVCDDRTDNDGDGRVDCRDPDCRETERCERARRAREILRMMGERDRPRPMYGVDFP